MKSAVNEIPEAAADIGQRFFTAADALRQQRRIRGLGTLAKMWGASRFEMSWAKNHPRDKRIKVEYLYYISRDFGVSLEWLFFGKGTMFQ